MSAFVRASVTETGADSGSILRGAKPYNKGLRLRIDQAQTKGNPGPIHGSFQILQPGSNKHAELLKDLLDVPLDSGGLLRLLRRAHPQCVNIVNANALVVEKGDSRACAPDANGRASPCPPESRDFSRLTDAIPPIAP